MPKGGDLHNRLTGSACVETYFTLATADGLWAETGMLNKEKVMSPLSFFMQHA
ncbi:MAG: hypothetical protein LBR26_04255 [Prevotella sp.]|jgi:adenosine deaminase|nr:hypothetical protein [Prevotella sp.]